jgi:hypothetical protein
MGYNLSDRGRRALDGLFSAIAQRNGAGRGVAHQFSLDPTSEQRLEDLQRESVGFLQRINVPGVRDLTGKVIGLGAANMIASRRSRANLPASPSMSATCRSGTTCSRTPCSTPGCRGS